MSEKALSELIVEMIAAEEVARVARELVCEFMGSHGVKSADVDGYAVAYVAPGKRTAYEKAVNGDPAVKAAADALKAAKEPYKITEDRAAYIRVKAV